MNNPPANKTSDVFRPIKPSLDGDLRLNNVQLLPTNLDIAKALVFVIMLAAAVRLAPDFRDLWASYVQRHGRPPHSKRNSQDSATGAAHGPTQQTEHRAEGAKPKVDGPKKNPPSITVSVEFALIANSRPSPSRVMSRESPDKDQSAKPNSTVPRTPFPAPVPIAYFDNAGRSFASKSARDTAETQRLAASLERFPAMKPQQRAMMRQRAFARLESLDMQQRINPAP